MSIAIAAATASSVELSRVEYPTVCQSGAEMQVSETPSAYRVFPPSSVRVGE